MPAKPRWLLHIPQILDLLRDLSFPVVDRKMCESLFGVGRRRAISLMQYFGGYRSGNTILVDRLDLIARLESLWEDPSSLKERKRKVRLAARLEAIRRARTATAVAIAVEPAVWRTRFPNLPGGVSIGAGELTVKFSRTEELLQRLFEVAQAAANDFEAFQAVVEQNAP